MLQFKTGTTQQIQQISHPRNRVMKRFRNAGIWLTVGALLFLIAAAVHGVIHPGVGATASDSMSRIAQQASLWVVAHLFFAVSAAIFSAGALVMLNTHSRLTDTLLGMVGWSLLAVFGGPAVVLTTMEATAQADAAVAGNLSTFVMWFSLSRGLEIVSILIPLALLAIAWNEFRAATPITPRWASALSMVGAVLVLVAIVGASGLRIVALGPLFSGAALPMLWLIWVGASMTRKATAAKIVPVVEQPS